MTETSAEADSGAKPSEVLTAKRPWHPNSLANLRPFQPGRSGNPSGLCKDGTSPKARAIAACLQERLAKPGGTERLVARWVRAAEKGSAQHLAMILERLYPVPQDSAQGKQVLTGLRLELRVGDGPVTHVRGLVAQQDGPMPAPAELRVEASEGVTEGGVHAPRTSESEQESQESPRTGDVLLDLGHETGRGEAVRGLPGEAGQGA